MWIDIFVCLPRLGKLKIRLVSSSPWSPGFRVDDYEIVSELGVGGMGTVYCVQHVATGGTYALKTLPLNAEPELLLRFEREGQAQAKVDAHPNVVRVHACGKAQGRAYLVMDLARGGDLQVRLREGPLDPDDAARVVRDLARGLAHVHAHGVLHRDLKPANVLFDERDAPMLVDFGLATLHGAKALTQTGTLMGSPPYMAPEQAFGLVEELDERTDVYGLGAILYSALTTQPPFSGANLIAVLSQVTEADPVPPSSLVDVPRDLEEICLRALSKKGSDRQASAADLADELEGFLKGGRAGGGSLGGARVAQGLAALAASAGVVAWVFFPPGASPRHASPKTETPQAAERGLAGSFVGPAEIRELKGVEALRASDEFLEHHADHPQARDVGFRRSALIKRPLERVPHPGVVEAQFCSNGERFVFRSRGSGVGGSTARTFTLKGRLLKEFPVSNGATALALDSSESLLALCSNDGNVTVRDFSSGENRARHTFPGVALRHVAIAPQGGALVAAGGGSLVARSWPSLGPFSFEVLLDLRSARQRVQAIAFSQEGTLYVATWGVEATHELLIFSDLAAAPVRKTLGSPPSRIRISPKQDCLAVGFTNGSLGILEMSGELRHTFDAPAGESRVFAHPGTISGLAFSPNGEELYSSSSVPETEDRNDVRRWVVADPASGAIVRPGGEDRFRTLDVSPDGTLLLLVRAGWIEVWSVEGLWGGGVDEG